MKNRHFLFLLIFLPVFNLSGIDFQDLNLSNDDRLLFRAEFESQRTIFVSTLADMSIQQLTAFPEKLQLVDNRRTILAVNHFGAAKISTAGGLPSALPGYPSFARGNVPLKGRLQELAASADGRWILYIEPTSPAYGNLFLAEISNGAKWIISERVELPASDFPAKWSPDSRLFVYSKGGSLYYFPIISDLSVLVDERFRTIGSGGITSVLWGQDGNFYYFLGTTLYHIRDSELFTRTIYRDFLSAGSVATALPLEFNSNFDRYWIAPDSGSILINKNGKGLFIFLLGENQNNADVLPHVTISHIAGNMNVIWSSSGHLSIISFRHNEMTVWRFEIGKTSIRNLASANVPPSSNGLLSPDGSRVVFWGENGLELWDYTNWQLTQRLIGEPVFSCVWLDNERLITGNARFIEEINISGSNFQRRRICLSSADEFGFEATLRGPSRIVARIGTEWFASDGVNPWVPVNNPQLLQVSLSSQRYRVFLEPQPAGHFNNIPMVRNIYSTGTVSLLSGHSANSAYALGRPMPVALCFDLYNDDTGLSQVLSALRRYNIKATFFLNGDFIRRNPLAAAAIAEAGHETASLFYAPIDLSDSRYRITREFIVNGLARNEDEFNFATGKELSLLWHPPFYRNTSLANTAAAEAGYKTVTATLDPGDWLSRDDILRLNLHNTSPSQMIEQIMGKKEAGVVIPIRLGLLTGGRDEYLFQRIDVLLDALIRSGCEIVPVSAVIGR
ncbi:MAG: polysaccharide deacetylase family protein [Treponema sp.]|jgi:peptidoglycan/xylan/chitin deacetylase (PgdA/CDA1 family)|nr:polysaccharide deacetylase family protein [Treponema sp.]